ncbi:amino acid adenylation domain-containing protein [Dactylosporangium sp. NPDC051484]|uniref:amino acid adenylation domain-containing protein n=1 Tax=Dactylosporangium sp. NPDC051484 TaxID=3154942 RepID=UPI00344B7304
MPFVLPPISRASHALTVPVELDPLRISAPRATIVARGARREPHPIDTGRTVVSSLVHWATESPQSTAVVHRDTTVSYADLARRVWRVRRRLLAAGCRPGDVVGCAGPRGVDTTAVFLALEGIGAVYLPLDLSWPAHRMAQILAASKASLVIVYGIRTTTAPEDAAATTGTPLITVTGADAGSVAEDESDGENAAGEPGLPEVLAEIDRRRCADDAEPRYLFYTSGSTGTPKGALIEHRGMVNHLHAKILEMGLTRADRLAFTAPLVFDIAVCQALLPIMLGGTSVVLDDDELRFPRILVAKLRDHQVSVIEVVPTVLDWIAGAGGHAAAGVPSLRLAVSTGEELRPALARRWFAAMPGTEILNAYGFTETSDDIAHHRVTAADLDGVRLPVGSPIINSTLYVLVEEDDGWRAAANGEPGELFVGGLPVGPGYPDDPVATRRAYLRDVLDDDSPTGRLYRTGDGAMLRDGLLYCLGRLDRQAKIGGVRIEPDEIEALLLQHPGIMRCAVLVHHAGDTPELVAFYQSATPTPAPAQLRSYLAERLPPAMVPQRFLDVPDLPLSANGKVDHAALAERLRPAAR